MAVRPIRLFPDSCLSRPCAPVRINTSTLKELIKDLQDTMAASPGVGLAAPQVGVMERVSVINVGRLRKKPANSTNHGPVVLINPRLVEGQGMQIPREGCLSVPDLLANVRRYDVVLVETELPEGGTRIFRAEGFEALAFQHELDHLDGKLFLDRVSNLKTDVFRRKSY